MKRDIHPNWYENARVTCACGASFTTGSTKEEIRVEICSSCHPFFTGQMKYVDTEGRVERFQKKQAQVQERPQVKAEEQPEEEERRRPETLAEMVELIKKKRAEEKKEEQTKAA